MKTGLKRIKASITVLWLSIISFPSKVVGRLASQVHSNDLTHMQTKYWVQSIGTVTVDKTPAEQISSRVSDIKVFQILLVVAVFIVWIINLVKIRKIDDRALRAKKTKKIIVFVVIALITVFLLSLWIRLIKKYTI